MDPVMCDGAPPPAGRRPRPGISHIFHVGSCPNCNKPIREPFSRMAGPFAYVHQPQGPQKGCRLIIIPNLEGGDPDIRVIPWGLALEGELATEIARYDYRARAA